MSTASVVPWCNPGEFMKVYEYLFRDEVTKKKWAIDEISVWETKCHPSLPSAIEATYLLTRAVVQDTLWTNKSNLTQHADIQAIYGSAVTRFVSLSVDTNRDKNHFGYSSAAQIAKLIGIPSYIVDVRNEWCHSKRPSISILRIAAEAALKYLKECYWEKEVAQIKSYVKQPPNEKGLSSLFKDYIKFQNDVFKGTKAKFSKKDSGRSEVNPEYVKLLRDLEKHLKKDARHFVKVLVSDGIFIPTDQELKDMLSKEDYELFSTEISYNAENEDEKMDIDHFATYLELLKKYLPDTPVEHETLWEPIIKLLNKYDAVPTFMEDLLISQGDRTTVGQKLLTSWIIKILQIHNAEFSVRCKRLKKIFRNKSIVPNWTVMLHSTVANPSVYAIFIIQLMLENINLERDVICHIGSLMCVKLGLGVSNVKDPDSRTLFYTPEDLKKALKRKRNNGKEEKEKSSDSIWSPCPDKCYSSWPIGHIINRVKGEDDETEENFNSIFQPAPKFKKEFNEPMSPSNKNEDDDDDDYDQTSQSIKQPDFNKMLLEIKKKDTVMLRRSD